MAPVSGSRRTFTSVFPSVLGALDEGMASALLCVWDFVTLCSVPPVWALSFEDRPRRW